MRGELSKDSKYYISKNRYYELKYFCLQYKDWKSCLERMEMSRSSSTVSIRSGIKDIHSAVEDLVIERDYYMRRIRIIETVSRETDSYIWRYLFKAVTEDMGFVYLKTYMDIPCGKDYYYDRYRRFFWLLDKEYKKIF